MFILFQWRRVSNGVLQLPSPHHSLRLAPVALQCCFIPVDWCVNGTMDKMPWMTRSTAFRHAFSCSDDGWHHQNLCAALVLPHVVDFLRWTFTKSFFWWRDALHALPHPAFSLVDFVVVPFCVLFSLYFQFFQLDPSRSLVALDLLECPSCSLV